MTGEKPKTVAIFNTSDETVMAMREVLEDEGYNTTAVHVDEIRRGQEDIIAFVEKHQPDVIVYDIPPPYDKNWNFFKLLHEALRHIPFVLTTTNRRALEEEVGELDIIELLGKPYDLEQLLNAVKKSLQQP